MIGALILGLVAGFVGKALMPGKDPGGFFVTILIGLAGAMVGYWLFRLSASATTTCSTWAAFSARSSA